MSLHHCFGDHVIGNCKAAPNPEVRLTGSQGVELARRYDLDVNPVVTMKVCQARHQPGGSEAVRGGDLQLVLIALSNHDARALNCIDCGLYHRQITIRSEERRGWKECVSTVRSRLFLSL